MVTVGAGLHVGTINTPICLPLKCSSLLLSINKDLVSLNHHLGRHMHVFPNGTHLSGILFSTARVLGWSVASKLGSIIPNTSLNGFRHTGQLKSYCNQDRRHPLSGKKYNDTELSRNCLNRVVCSK